MMSQNEFTLVGKLVKKPKLYGEHSHIPITVVCLETVTPRVDGNRVKTRVNRHHLNITGSHLALRAHAFSEGLWVGVRGELRSVNSDQLGQYQLKINDIDLASRWDKVQDDSPF